MRRDSHEIAGPITIEQDTRLRGIVAGDVRVTSGAHHGRAHDRPRRLPSATTGADRDLRASDAEREVVIAGLREHMVAGRLDVSEFEQRVAVALAARTRAELTALERDLRRVCRDHRGEGATLPRGRTQKVCPRRRNFAAGERATRRLSRLAGKTAGALVLVTLLALPAVLAGEGDNPVGLCEKEVTYPSAYGPRTQVEDRRDGWQMIDGRRVSCRSGEAVALGRAA